MGQIWSEIFVPESKFVPERDIPDLSGRVIIVTGGNTGIGKETVKELLKKNAKVYMASRTKSRADQAIADLKAQTGKEAIFLELNLGNLDAITRAANEFKSKEPALHALINNAGVMIPPLDQLTDDGYDLQFGTNVLGHAHFTLCLIPELIAGAKSSPDGKARVINVSSSAAYFTSDVVWETLRDSPKRTSMGSKLSGKSDLYNQSKFGNVVFSNELARRFADQGIISNALNPGNLETELQRHAGWVFHFFIDWTLYPAPFGALTQLWAATSPEAATYNGAWFIPWARVGKIGAAAKNSELGTRLWDWIEEQRKSHV